ncbi:MAG: hypothetical protein WC932_06135 [archaeon]|jgi:recombination protein RecA
MAAQKTQKHKNPPMPAELVTALAVIKKTYGGDNLVIRLGDKRCFADGKGTIPSCSFAVDQAVGIFYRSTKGEKIYGLPRGRFIEIYGEESTGKTTWCLLTAAAVQKKGGRVAFVDVEQTIDPAYARKLGVNVDDLWLSQPEYGEQALDILMVLAKTNVFDLIICDSIASLLPKAEMEKASLENDTMGQQGKMMSMFFRRNNPVIGKTMTTVIFTNQTRESLKGYGKSTYQPGGKGSKFYSTIRMELSVVAKIKEGGKIELKDGAKDERPVIGQRIKFLVVKNKVGTPFRYGEFDLIFGHGVDEEGVILDSCVERGMIELKGAWYSCDGHNIGQGRSKVVEYFRGEGKTQFESLRNALIDSYIDEEEVGEIPAAGEELHIAPSEEDILVEALPAVAGQQF